MMAVFRYTAIGASGTRTTGELVAETAAQAREALRRSGLAPLALRERSVNRRRTEQRSSVARAVQGLLLKRRRAALVEFYEGLASLLAAGVRIVPALEQLSSHADGMPRRLATTVRAMTESVRGGSSLADAMSDVPDWFGGIDVALVRAAESSGDLDRTVALLADDHAHADELTGRLALALAYPLMLLVFGTGVAIYLSTSTLPQIVSVIVEAGQSPPALTSALLRFGELITQWWPVALLGSSAGVGVAIWLSRWERTAALRLRIPLLGRLIQRAQIGSTSVLIARLVDAGITLNHALTLAAPSLPNPALKRGLLSARDRVREGATTSGSIASAGVFDPVFVRVMHVGEESGELAATLKRVGERYRASARRLTDRLAGIAEPVAILILAVMIGTVAYAAIAPILSLSQTISGG